MTFPAAGFGGDEPGGTDAFDCAVDEIKRRLERTGADATKAMS
jgi:hypothetical protein